MEKEEFVKKFEGWLTELKGKKLPYISGQNAITIIDYDKSEKKVIYEKKGTTKSLSLDRFDAAISALLIGESVHIDTVYTSGGNDRTVIETMLAYTPHIGHIKKRSEKKKKELLFFKSEISLLGELVNLDDPSFEHLFQSDHQQDQETETLVYSVPVYKPFILLAGISGTGKTRFVREQAKMSCPDGSNYKLIPVRPDWHEPSDLLGYISRLSESPLFIATECLQFIINAWKHIFQCQPTRNEDSISLTENNLQQVVPYWICLDEMNLAPVEQYFSDFLSILETRTWHVEKNQHTYFCDPLIGPYLFNEIDEQSLSESLSVDLNGDLWKFFKHVGIPLPFNMVLAGTVNMDETTHGFSRKVIDRTITLDHEEFFPNDFTKFFNPDFRPTKLTFPVITAGSDQKLLSRTFDSDGSRTIDFLTAVNEALTDTPFKLAYRALNELLLSVITIVPSTEQELIAVWDDFVMTKILPRIEGDIDKLTPFHATEGTVLTKLEDVLSEMFSTVWSGEQRIDFYRNPINKEAADSAERIYIDCRSKKKISWMIRRLEVTSFTNFWP